MQNKFSIFENYSEKKRDRSYIKWLVLLIIIALIVLGIIWAVSSNKENNIEKFEKDYKTALDEEDYTAAYDVYKNLQNEIAQMELQSKKVKTSELEQHKESLARAIALRESIEKEAREQTIAKLNAIFAGKKLDETGRQQLSESLALVSNNVITYLERLFRSYCLKDISEIDYVNFINSIATIPGYKDLIEPYAANFACIREMRDDFSNLYQLYQEKKYLEAIESIETIEQSSNCAQVQILQNFIRDLKTDVLKDYYEKMISKIDELFAQNRYYDANEIIYLLYQYFPDDEKLLKYKDYTDKYVKQDFVNWRDSIPALSLKPVIADPNRAFDGDIFSEKAKHDLITASEFNNLLQLLYDNDFILIRASSIYDEAAKLKSPQVPRGKKPLLLFFDEFYFNPQRSESGLCARLTINSNEQISAVMRSKAGDEIITRQASSIAILEDFLKDNPDFSLNGAKAVLVLSGIDGLFGYPLDNEQLQYCQTQALSCGQNSYCEALTDLAANKKNVKKIIDYLNFRQWEFASQSYSRPFVPQLDIAALNDDLDKMQSIIEDFVDKIEIFSFPFGEHVEGDRELANFIADNGYKVQSGSGTPHAYSVQKDNYVYLNRQEITADTLRNPIQYGLEEFIGAVNIIDESIRD